VSITALEVNSFGLDIQIFWVFYQKDEEAGSNCNIEHKNLTFV
jgi:hypothetical protein